MKTFRTKLLKLRRIVGNSLTYLNIPKHVCHHMFGRGHTKTHRIFVGMIVMAVGVIIAKIHAELILLHYTFDLVGYLLHGIGATPIVEALVKSEEIAEEL